MSLIPGTPCPTHLRDEENKQAQSAGHAQGSRVGLGSSAPAEETPCLPAPSAGTGPSPTPNSMTQDFSKVRPEFGVGKMAEVWDSSHVHCRGLPLYSGLCLISSEYGPLTSSVTPVLILAHTPLNPRGTHAHARTHTLPLSLWLLSGRATLERLHYVSLRAGHLVNEALPGEEKQPARTGCFLPWLWSREKAARDGRGVEENRPFSTRKPNI